MTGFGGLVQGPITRFEEFVEGDRFEDVEAQRRGAFVELPQCGCCVVVLYDDYPDAPVVIKRSFARKLSILERIAEVSHG